MNQHYEDARSILSIRVPADTLEGVVVMLEAQAEATLALAYEQRTANLIALMADQSMRADAEKSGRFPDGAGVEISATIRERLGLA